MISVSDLCKSYSGSSFAVRNVSFDVRRGEVVGFLGPNGAGKTTTLRVLSGYLGATSGTVRLGDHDLASHRAEAVRLVGYMPEAVPLYPELRVREYLRFRAELKQVAAPKRRSAVSDAMEQVRVTDVADKLIGHLSKGYRQRVGLADALVARPPILLLDEPTAGLDPNQIREVRALLSRLRSEHAILLSTHILPEVEATCDRVVVIARGELVAQGTLQELGRLREARSVRVRVTPNEGARSVLQGLPGVGQVEAEIGNGTEGTFVVTWASTVGDVDAACEVLASETIRHGLALRELSPVQASLEQVFADLTEGAKA